MLSSTNLNIMFRKAEQNQLRQEKPRGKAPNDSHPSIIFEISFILTDINNRSKVTRADFFNFPQKGIKPEHRRKR